MRKIKSQFFNKILWAVFILSIPIYSYAGTKLAVFYGSTISAKDREKELKSKTGEDDSIVFGRSKDFFEAIDQSSIPVIIAPSLIEISRSDYDPVLQFSLEGKKDFLYKIITLKGATVPVSKLASVNIGMLEEIDKEKMKAFFKDKVGLDIQRISTVTKPEDLFNMLVLGVASAIVVSSDNFSSLTKSFKTDISEVKVETRPILYPRVYVKKGESSELIKKLGEMSKDSLKVLGFDGLEGVTK